MVSTLVHLDDALGAVLGLETATRASQPAPVRAVQCVMDKRRPRMIMQSSVPRGASFEADKPQIVALFEDDEPCIVGVKIGADLSQWAMIAWVPDSVSEQRKRVYQKNATQLAEQLKPKVVKKVAASTMGEVEDFLAKVEEDLGDESGTFKRGNTQFTEFSKVELSRADSKDDRNEDFHSPREGDDDLRAEVKTLRDGLAAVQKECSSLRRLLGAGSLPSGTKNTNDLESVKHALATEKQLRGMTTLECDDLQERMEKAEKVQGVMQARLDEDLSVLKLLKTDFDGLVAILDEELTALEEKSERKESGMDNRISSRSGKSEFISRISQGVRKSIATQQAGISPLLQQEIDELKERMDDSEKVHVSLEEQAKELTQRMDNADKLHTQLQEQLSKK